jgi:hypothetical protein
MDVGIVGKGFQNDNMEGESAEEAKTRDEFISNK